ncbi:hypothetical protein ACHAXS_010651 [Conticribra weissflogii]
MTINPNLQPTPPPKPEVITATLSSCSEADDPVNTTSASFLTALASWQDLVLKCLSYGTDYDRLHSLPRGTMRVDKIDEERKRRAMGAAKLLGDGLETYLTTWWQRQLLLEAEANSDGNERVGNVEGGGVSSRDAMDIYKSTTKPFSSSLTLEQQRKLQDDPVICTVVESLWLVGCLLDTTEDSASNVGDSGDSGTQHLLKIKKDLNDCLVLIIRELTEPRPWLKPAESAAKAKRDSSAMDTTGSESKNDKAGVAADENTAISLPLIPITTLQTSLELSLLESADLLPQPSNASTATAPAKRILKSGKAVEPETPVSLVQKRLKKINTDMYYRQHKFNLLAEESEGYAKLLTFLIDGLADEGRVASVLSGMYEGDGNNDTSNGGEPNEDYDLTDESIFHESRKQVRELIGAFDLDPNRVLDLALDVLEWELNEVVSQCANNSALKSSSFSEISNLSGGGVDDWNCWSLPQMRLAIDALNNIYVGRDDRRSNNRSSSSSSSSNKMSSSQQRSLESHYIAIQSLLAIIRELDGTACAITSSKTKSDDGKSYEGRAIAHLLGFKYRSYHNRAVSIAANQSRAAAAAAASAASGSGANEGGASTNSASTGSNSNTSTASLNRVYPRSLYVLTAFLCSHGMLDPHALFPHLISPVGGNSPKSGTASGNPTTPLMETFQKYCMEAVQKLKKLGVVSLNASKATDASKDPPTSNANESASSTSDSFRNDPIIGIFRALLAIVGDWNEAVAFLAHAAVPGFTSEKDELKMVSAMDAAALAACTLSEGVGTDVVAWVLYMLKDIDSNSNSTGSSKNGVKKFPPLVDDMCTLCQEISMTDLSFTLRRPLEALVGSGKIKLNSSLFSKLCQLYKRKLTPQQNCNNDLNDNEVEIASRIDNDTLEVLSKVMVPSLSLFPSDTAIAGELWSVLKLLPYTFRYRLYSSWRQPGLEKGTLRSLMPAAVRSGKIPKPLGIIESEIETGIAARYVLKRISKENIKDMGKKLSQTSHNNPLVVFTYILSQIESYDNMILMMVDTFQFVTPLGLDVMGYCMLCSLGGGDDSSSGQRSRTTMGGLNTTQWLASLETFAGAFYNKFPEVEVRGILIYLTQRFREGEASELGVLRSLIKAAGGYGFVDYDSTASLSELQLDGRCGSRLLKRETSSFGVVDNVNRKASRHLRAVLQRDDLGVIMLILLSQIRPKILYSKKESEKQHIKVIGNMYDDVEAVLCLLLEYLSDSSDDLPSGPGTKERYAASLPTLSDLHGKYGVDTAMAWMLCRPLLRKSMFYSDDSKVADKAEVPAYLKDFIAGSPEMLSSYKSLLPEPAWKHITFSLFEAFYSYSIYDICCPEERYNIEIGRLKKEIDRLTQLQRGGSEARATMSALAAAAAAAGGTAAQIQQATSFTQNHLNELNRLKNNSSNLEKDFDRQKKRCNLVETTLEAQKDTLISDDRDPIFSSAFITFCVYPRCMLSPEDALYCAHFVKLLHKLKVKGFSTIEVIDNIINSATGSLYCVTEDEAGNLSIFVHEIWKVVNSWRYNDDCFAIELMGAPGSKLSKDFAELNSIGAHSVSEGLTKDDYNALYTQWHQKLGIAAIGCLKSPEYMYTRSALILLSRIVLVFPTQPKMGEKILKALTPLQSDDNPRPDIRATAQGYSSQLLKARDEGMWKEENIAVTKARQEKEKQKQEERKKKLAQQHEEMKKESEMIARQIGEDNWRRDGGRDNRGRGGQWGMDSRMHPRVQGPQPPPPPPPPLNANAPKFTPAHGGEVRDLNSFGQRRDPHDNSRDRRPGMEQGQWERGTRQIADNSLIQTRRKRSRSPDRGDRYEDPSQKRSRGGGWDSHQPRGNTSSYSGGDRRSSSPSRGRNPPSSDVRGGDRRQERRGGSSRH